MAKKKVVPLNPMLDGDDIPDVGLVAPPGESLHPVDEPAVVKAKRPIRHSDIPAGVDAFHWIRNEGYLNPTRKYRVTPVAKPELAARLKSLEVEAVDEAEAVNKYIVVAGIPAKLVHSMNFHAVPLTTEKQGA